MATKAFILITTTVGKTNEIVRSLRSVAGFQTIDAVTGPYDIIAVVEADNLNDVGDLVTKGIHDLEGVERTTTLLAMSTT